MQLWKTTCDTVDDFNNQLTNNMKLNPIFLMISFALALGQVYAYEVNPGGVPDDGSREFVFRFMPEDDLFYVPWQGNGENLEELCSLLSRYGDRIRAAGLTIGVEGYCASYDTQGENLRQAALRANRVKSELILRCGVTEDDFKTTVHASRHQGWRSAVVVTLRIPAVAESEEPEPTVSRPEPEKAPESKVEEQPAPQILPEDDFLEEPVVTEPGFYRFSVRTNLLHDAFLMPSLGAEWRINRHWGVKADFARSQWGKESGRVQKLWLVNPELRYYWGRAARFYTGLSGSFGEFNLYQYPLGNLLSKETGYQGDMWNAGLTGGYQLPLSKSFAIDFNVGLGYNHFSYDTFGMSNKVRVYKEKNRTKKLWGPTQAGVTVVWTIGGSNQ